MKKPETKEFKKRRMEYCIETFGSDFIMNFFGEEHVKGILNLKKNPRPKKTKKTFKDLNDDTFYYLAEIVTYGRYEGSDALTVRTIRNWTERGIKRRGGRGKIFLKCVVDAHGWKMVSGAEYKNFFKKFE